MTTIHLDTGIERPSDPEDYITKIAGTTMAKPGTPHPLWDDFLSRVTNNNAELIAFLQRFLGYCMTGETREHVLLFLYGKGANGKGVFINTIVNVFGDYAVVAPMDLFMASKHERHPTEIAKLRGARLVVAQETEKGRHWDAVKIKMLTSEDKLTGRFMRQDFFDFKPTHKLIISGNYKPSLRSVDEGMRRRRLLVPLTVTIPIEERDPQFAERLKPEYPAILRWILDGCLEWHSDGLRVPEIVRNASDEYFEEQDVMGLWLEASTDRVPRAFTTTTVLFKNWKVWCEDRNHYVGTERAFNDDLVDHGFTRDRKKYGRGFNDIMLRTFDGQPSPEAPSGRAGDAW
jgi:putative DNA primase/helicase